VYIIMMKTLLFICVLLCTFSASVYGEPQTRKDRKAAIHAQLLKNQQPLHPLLEGIDQMTGFEPSALDDPIPPLDVAQWNENPFSLVETVMNSVPSHDLRDMFKMIGTPQEQSKTLYLKPFETHKPPHERKAVSTTEAVSLSALTGILNSAGSEADSALKSSEKSNQHIKTPTLTEEQGIDAAETAELYRSALLAADTSFGDKQARIETAKAVNHRLRQKSQARKKYAGNSNQKAKAPLHDIVTGGQFVEMDAMAAPEGGTATTQDHEYTAARQGRASRTGFFGGFEQCPAALVSQSVWDEAAVASHLAVLAYQATSAMTGTTIKHHNAELEVIHAKPAKQIRKMLHKWDVDLPYIVAVDRKRRVIYAAIRGSYSVNDWTANFRVLASPFKFGRNERAGLIHSGFLKSMTNIPSLFDHVQQAVSAFSHDDVPHLKLRFCGHSLGGAVAQIASFIGAHLKFDLPTQGSSTSTNSTRHHRQHTQGGAAAAPSLIEEPTTEEDKHHSQSVSTFVPRVYTFGSPRVGNRDWQQSFGDRVEHVRIVNNMDAVARIPPVILHKDQGRPVMVWHSDDVTIQFDGTKDLAKPKYACINSAYVARESLSVNDHKMPSYSAKVTALAAMSAAQRTSHVFDD
jgi:predicted lipase